MITNTDLALALAAGVAILAPALAWALTWAWYVGRHRDNQDTIAGLIGRLKTADQVIAAAESAGFIQADHPRGRHEATPTTEDTE